METIRAILWGILGAVAGLILGMVCGFAIGWLLTPHDGTWGDALNGFFGLALGAGLGALVGFGLGLSVPSWRHNHQRQKRLQTLRRQRSRRAFLSGEGVWPPAPKSMAGVEAATTTDDLVAEKGTMP